MATEARGLNLPWRGRASGLECAEAATEWWIATDSNQNASPSAWMRTENGVSTGISAEDRARTIPGAIHPQPTPGICARPATSFTLGPGKAACFNTSRPIRRPAVDLFPALGALIQPAVISRFQNVGGFDGAPPTGS